VFGERPHYRIDAAVGEGLTILAGLALGVRWLEGGGGHSPEILPGGSGKCQAIGTIRGCWVPPAPVEHPAAMWLKTCARVLQPGISRQTLWRLRRVRILLRGHHSNGKTPGCPRSDILWHIGRRELALKRWVR
jgi:hypothetical protein